LAATATRIAKKKFRNKQTPWKHDCEHWNAAKFFLK